MADISRQLQKIMEAVYGEEVRGSIYDALVAMNAESTNAMSYASTARDSAQAYASSAQSSAATAGDKASEASSSASAAAASQAQARISEQNAANSESAASASATRAATSEQNAANSEAVALQKANEADVSKTAAALSASNAATQEAATMMLRNQAEGHANQARAEKEAAQTAKTAAETAQGLAEAAQSAAETAQAGAEAAEANSLAAESVVIQSKNDAEAANTAAQAAKTAAQTAQGAAESARDAAQTAETNAADSATDAAASALSAKQYAGKPARPDDTTKTWWIWNSATQQYEDSGIGSDIEGPQGVGISDIRLTDGDHTPGTADTYTVYLTDGRTYNMVVWNGRNGEGAGDVLGQAFDLTIPAAAWSDGQCTIGDNRLIALSTYKYFIGPEEACREEYLECGVRARDITTTGLITFVNESDPDADLTVQVLRFELSANG